MGQEPAVIEVQVEKIGQLFDTLDPMPFREKDLDREAEDYIVGWARELPRKAPIRILIHMPASEASGDHAQMLGQAVGRYFSYRAGVLAKDLRELFRAGRYSLCVGLVVLAACIASGGLILRSPWFGEFGRLLNEGLVILGWVANWRPIEIFLYDWWPIIRHRNILRRLARAEIVVAPRA
ncbi:MAG TPA: hypothetical protein VJS85_02795 [Rhizomicrobium sp.]|nr:hypothetical protein [Rhizomicrobium sp.]